VLRLLVVPAVLVEQLLLGGQLLETLVVVLLLVPDFDLVEALVLQGGPESWAVVVDPVARPLWDEKLPPFLSHSPLRSFLGGNRTHQAGFLPYLQ
jgi:hypothetical protein